MYLVPDLLLGDDDVLLRVRDEHEGEPALLFLGEGCLPIDCKRHTRLELRRRCLMKHTSWESVCASCLAVDVADREACPVDGDVPFL